MMKRLRYLFLILVSIGLAACTPQYTNPQQGQLASQQINQELAQSIMANQNINAHGGSSLPSDVNHALMPGLAIQRPNAAITEKKFNVSVEDVPAQTFFPSLVHGTKYNMVVDPKVTGTITLHLQKITIPEVLQAVRDIYGYQFKKTTYGYYIFPSELENRIFTVNYLDVTRSGESNTLVSSGQLSQKVDNQTSSTNTRSSSTTKNLSPTSSIATKSNSDFWKTLADTVQSIVGDKDGRKVVVNPQAGLVVVRAMPDELNEVAQYLDSLQSTMTRQVILDTKILEVELTNGYNAGIDWNALGISQDTSQQTSGGLTAFTHIFALNARRGNGFNFLLKLLSTQGNVQTLSSPRIATLNNQKAVIKVGSDSFFVTNVSSSTVASSSTETTQDVDLTPFFSGISLDVTPEIDSSGAVILHIHPVVSTVTEENKSFTVSGKSQNLPLASSKIRETDSIVRAQNGQVVVIAGLMENKTNEQIAQTPFLGKLPGVGPLFRRTQQASTKTELVILLRPIVVGDNTWTKELRKQADQFKKLDRGFHFGSQPEIFGNMGDHGH